MPSQFDSMMTGGGNGQLEVHHAETITHYPGGTGAGVPVTLIAERVPQEMDDRRGDGYLDRVKLSCPTSLAVTRDDRWTVEGVDYFVDLIHLPESGFRVVEVVNREADSITSPGRSGRDF